LVTLTKELAEKNHGNPDYENPEMIIRKAGNKNKTFKALLLNLAIIHK